MVLHRGRAALEGFPITCVEDRWLHVTVDQITDRVGADISPAEREALADELTKRLGNIEPFDVMIGSLESYATGVIADIHPDEPLRGLRQPRSDRL